MDGKKKKKYPLHIRILLGLILGIAWATLATVMGWQDFTMDWLDPFGKIFIRLLKLIAVPLVLFSIIQGVAGMGNVGSLGRLGIKTLGFYLYTTVMAVTIGLTLVNTLKPGRLLEKDTRLFNRMKYELWAGENGKTVKDQRCFSCLPENGVFLEEARGQLKREDPDDKLKQKLEEAGSFKEKGPLQPLVDMIPENVFASLNDMSLMLQVIFFAIFFGISMILVKKEFSQPVLDFVRGGNEIFLKMVDLVMEAAPWLVFALTAGVMVETAGNDPAKLLDTFKALGGYILVVIFGLATMLLLVYPLMIRLFLRKFSYKQFFRSLAPAQLLAFSSSSSAATLPVTMECVTQNLKVPETVADFVIPIGATVNMDGTSLYQAVAVVFLAQIHMIDLGLGQQMTIVLTATLASIGSAAVPGAGLVMLILVLSSVGLNPAWIAIVLPVDRILDMCRTVVNVTSDATVSTLVARSEEKGDPMSPL